MKEVSAIEVMTSANIEILENQGEGKTKPEGRKARDHSARTL